MPPVNSPNQLEQPSHQTIGSILNQLSDEVSLTACVIAELEDKLRPVLPPQKLVGTPKTGGIEMAEESPVATSLRELAATVQAQRERLRALTLEAQL